MTPPAPPSPRLLGPRGPWTARLPRSAAPARLLQTLAQAGFDAREPRELRTAATALDTQNGRLDQAGLRLLRRREPPGWELLAGGRTALALDAPAPGDRPPPGPIAERVDREIGSRRLVPLLEITAEGSAHLLRGPSGRVLPLRLLRLRFVGPAGGRSVAGPHLLVLGTPASGAAAEIELAARVLAEGGAEFRSVDPVAEGLAALGLPPPGAPVPDGFRLTAADTALEAARKTVAHQAWLLWANTDGARLEFDPEYLHDLRVAARRARFALRLWAPVLGEERCRVWRERLGAFNEPLETVRDLDVFLERLDPLLRRVEAPETLARFVRETTAERRVQAQHRLATALVSARWRGLVDELRRLGDGRDTASPDAGSFPVGGAAPELLGPAEARVLKWRKRRPEKLTAEELHQIRIATRRLRYACEFFADLYGRGLRGVIRELVALQDCLGDHQDAAVAVERLHRLVEERRALGTPSTEELLALGGLLQVHRETAASRRAEFAGLWRRLPERLRTLVRITARRPAPPASDPPSAP